MTTPALQWTEPARAGLERYFAARLVPSLLDGADAAEVRSDLESHLEEELSQNTVTTVTVEDLRQALAKMGEVLPPPANPAAPATHPEIPAPAPGPSTAAGAARSPTSALRERFRLPLHPRVDSQIFGISKPRWAIRFFGLTLPMVVFLFEVVTRGCSGTLFDPMPDLAHHLLVLSVPSGIWIFLRSLKPDASPKMKSAAPWATGAALAVSAYYALCFLPTSPMAVLGIVVGVGFLALVPIFSFFAVFSARRALRKEGDARVSRGLHLGFWLASALLLLVELPGIVSWMAVWRADHAGPGVADRVSFTKMIRRFGSETELLRQCYPPWLSEGGKSPAAWLGGWVTGQYNFRGETTARDLYYRVTGTLFSEKAKPKGYSTLIQTSFSPGPFGGRDTDRGGSQVAGEIEGLSLAEGRIDWHCEQASGLTWGEWTLTFANTTADAQEARCRIALPPGGFVSRLTLWVNDQPEEAAYSTVSKVRAAYQKVAVQQRRDPVLVTQSDAGSVMVQAFPVPAHGKLKTRVTFTVPAGADSRIWLPAIVEKNFAIPPDSRQPLWIQADHGALELPESLRPHATTEAGAATVTASLTSRDLTGAGAAFNWSHQSAPVVFCEDPFAAPEAKTVIRTESPAQVFQPGAVAWVMDTSAPMKPHAGAIATALKSLSLPGQTAVFLPTDDPRDWQTITDGSQPDPDFAGGRDNSPALTAALEWLRGKPQACLIWIHGVQPAMESTRGELEQILQRSVSPLTLLDVPLVLGENSLGPLLADAARISLVPVRHDGPDLAASIQSAFRQRGGKFTTLPEGTAPPEGAVKVSDTLARWMARTEAARLAANDLKAASTLAASHQIVSPWSGAVVLERSSDYANNGLSQSSAAVSQVIPTIPEPSNVLLLLLSASHFLLRRRRQP